MRKTIAGIFVAVTVLFSVAMPVFAYDPFKEPCAAGSSSEFCKNATQQASEDRIAGPNGILTKITQFIVFLAGGFAVIMVTLGGAKYTFSAGDSNAVKSAKDTILYALIGLVVALFSQAMVVFVLSKL